eukprot:6983527-Pyramimonas_sp.AAC.2
MGEAGVPPDTVTFNTLLKACAAGGQAAAAEGVFARMEEFDGDPRPNSFPECMTLFRKIEHVLRGLKDPSIRRDFL